MDNEKKTLHLQFIQDVITRMNKNSFQIKGWYMTILSAILAILASTKNINFILVPILPALLFWFIDTYYLLQERKFRGLYNDVAGISNKIDNLKLYEMRPDLYNKKISKKYTFFNVFKSQTIYPLYFFSMLSLILLFLYFKTNFNFCELFLKLCK